MFRISMVGAGLKPAPTCKIVSIKIMNPIEPLIFDKSSPGRRCFNLPACDVPEKSIQDLLPAKMLRRHETNLPEVSEIDVVRHFTRISQMNFCVDTNFYPLGSCTMKYNPKINEDAARLAGFGNHHPFDPESISQGSLQLLYELQEYLKEITGMPGITLQPAAGAHGELTGVMLMQAYFRDRAEKRTKILIPD